LIEGEEVLVIAKPTGEQEEVDIFDIDCVTKIIFNECGEDLFDSDDLVYVQN
jgi:hypothetical protein